MVRSRASAVLFVSLWAAALPAQDLPSWTLQADPVALKPGESAEWRFPEVHPGRGQRLVIEWQARVEFQRPAGSMFFCEVTFNEQRVDACIDRVRRRLLNKPLSVGEGAAALDWNWPLSGWRVLYAPDFEPASAGAYGPEGFRYVVDVTDLAAAGENVLRIRRAPVVNANPMVVQGVSARVETGEPAFAASLDELHVPADAPLKITPQPNGAVTVEAGDAAFELGTRISHPSGGWYLLGERVAGEPAHAAGVSVEHEGPTARYRIQGDGFHVERTIRIDGEPRARVAIEETFTNESDRDLGWRVAYELALAQPAPDIWLGGSGNPGVFETYAPFNPTVFVPYDGLSLGLVAEDDVLRAQALYAYRAEPATLSVHTDRLALPPGGTVTLRMVLHVLRGGDYFDFVNRVRADWGVRVTVPGPVVWGFDPRTILNLADDELRADIVRLRVWAFSSGGGWVDYTKQEPKPRQIGFGLGILEPYFDHWRSLLRDAAAKIHNASPGTKVIDYVHCFFNEPEPDPERFRDSWILRADGQRFAVGWGGDFTLSGGVYPTLENRFGPAFAQMIDTLMADWGADGVYWDETTHPSGMTDPLTYGVWDGHTALLDPGTHAVREKVGHLYLLTKDYKLWLYERLRERGATLLGNGQPVCLATNQSWFPRFTETHTNLDRARESHLYTPLAYGGTNQPMAELRRRLELGMLHQRVGLKDASEVVGWFYPITITDLHRGWVRGEERIVTTRSGQYGWSTPTAARLLAWDAGGQRVTDRLLAVAPEHTVPVPEGGVAVLERRD